ncbi:extracellular calcium-sensing receptor-like [Lates calcarifer]|uniref:Extracellular calcium-sensing receptor-like n=1 Tax=Lates calcarifer TaxID=8187 RepID=A0AAJ8AVT4_LATCA|nr:extracellular calcium-sensing receptor-like [Lates calcarifer]
MYMHICALLLCCLAGMIQWVYGGEPCQLMVKSTPGSIYKAGDVVIGGLFPVHKKAPQPELDFRSEEVNASCEICLTKLSQFLICVLTSDVHLSCYYFPLFSFNQRGYRWLQVMIFAVEEINNNSHLLPNFTLGYLAADTCLVESTTLLAALAMISGQEAHLANSECGSVPTVPVIVGDARPSSSIVVANTLGVFDIPMVSYLASCECLSDKRRYPLFFRTMPSIAAQAQAMAELLRLMGWTWVGLVSADDDFGRSGIQMLVDALRGTEVCVAYHEVIPEGYSKTVIKRIVETIQKSTARVVVTFFIVQEAKGVLNSPEITVFILCDESLLGIGESLYTDVSQIRITYNVYKAVYAIAHAIKDMLACEPGKGPFLDGQCPDVRRLQPLQVNKILRSLDVTNFIIFRSDMKQPFSLSQIAHYLRKVNFTTPLKEWMNFDENGDPPASYDIINWHVTAQGTIEFVTVGHFMSSQGSTFHIDIDRVVWGGGSGHKVPVSVCSNPCPPGTRKAVQKGRPVCCFDCLPCADGEISNETGSVECIRCPERFWSNSNNTVCVPRQVDFLSHNDTMGIVLSILSAVGAALTTATYATFLYHRHTPLVRANNSEVSFILLLSLKLCFLCALAFIGQPLAWLCMLRHTLFGISFVLCISCLLSRTVVVLVAFRSTLPGENLMRYVGPAQQRVGISICTLVQVLICGLWLTLAPPQPTERDIVDNWGPKIILECATGSVVGFSFVLGYIGLLACVCLLLAFLARKLPDNFNEAKLITFSMLIFCTVWVAFVPAYISSPGKYAVAVEIFAILASSYGLLFCIFAPKCFVILLRPERNTKKHLMAR